MISRTSRISLLIYTCLFIALFTPTAQTQDGESSGIDRSQVVGTWEGVIGTSDRNASLLRVKLILRTGLETSNEAESSQDDVEKQSDPALDEARARIDAIREGRDAESTVGSQMVDNTAAQERAAAIESARLRRERSRADRLEGTLEFSPLYGEGKIRTGLSGVPSIKDGTGICEVVAYLDTHSGSLTVNLTRWAEQPKTNLLQTNQLQLVLDPEEPVLFGESKLQRTTNVSFRPVIAWREGQAPEQEMKRIEEIAYPNHFGGTRISTLRRDLSEYLRKLKHLESVRPTDTIDADFASRYTQAKDRLESDIERYQSTYEKTMATYDSQEADLDAQEAAGDLSDSQMRRIASKRESIAGRREKAEEQLEERKTDSKERYAQVIAELDERVAVVRAEFEEEVAEHNTKLEELEASRADVERSISVDNEVISAWIEHIAREHPEITAGEHLNFGGRNAHNAIQNALRDDVFVEIFGTSYDDLTEYDMLILTAYFDMRNELYDENGEVSRTSQPPTTTTQNRGRIRTSPQENTSEADSSETIDLSAQRDEQRELLHGGLHFIKAPFTDDYEQNIVRLYVQERSIDWIDRVRDAMESIRPDADTFAHIDAIERTLALRSHILRPSEQEAALLITIEARRKHADATAIALAQKTVKEAKGQAGIASLSYFWAQNPALNRLVSDQTRGAIDGVLDEGLDRAIIEVVQRLSGRIETLESTNDPYEALKLGAGIYRDFLSQIGGAKRRPAAQRILAAIAERRPRDLEQVRESVSAQILAAESAKQAQEIASTVITLPSDAETTAGELVMLSVSIRTLQLESEALRALYSDREWSLLDEQKGRLVVPDQYDAPSEEEIRLATIRAFAVDGGEVLDPSTCMHVVPGLGNLNVKLRMQLHDVRIVSTTQRENGSYDVLYTFRRRITPEGSLTYFANDDYWQGTLLLDMLDAFGDNVVESSIESFRLGPYGWYSPTLIARLDLASAMQPLRVLTGERRDR